MILASSKTAQLKFNKIAARIPDNLRILLHLCHSFSVVPFFSAGPQAPLPAVVVVAAAAVPAVSAALHALALFASQTHCGIPFMEY